MPKDWVDHWPELGRMAEGLAARQEELTDLGAVRPPLAAAGPMPADFSPKDDSDYIASIRGGAQRRSRKHEWLVREAGEWLHERGATISNPHPRDLLISAPSSVLVEAKIVGDRGAVFAIRDAVGQLLEYRHFLGPQGAELCILLDEDPGASLEKYVEAELGFLILWHGADGLNAGSQTAEKLTSISLSTRGQGSGASSSV